MKKGLRKYVLPDGKVYYLNNDYKTGGKYETKNGRPIYDVLHRFEDGKNVEYFKKAKEVTAWRTFNVKDIKGKLLELDE
tara:strand:- start:213 stop:449 length:237 start_codon:yes stop_codon:yes gene_type:complete